MLRVLIAWAVHNPLIVVLLTLVLTAVGTFALVHVNVEAYPDPAPAIVEVVVQYPGASPEEVERQVTIPLEVALSGMPGLKYTRSKSLFGLSHLRNQFDYGVDYNKAKQEVINRLAMVQLPGGAQPQISPTSPTGEIYRYTLANPRDALGRELYTLNDLKAVQDWYLVREFSRIPRIAGVGNYGGTVKRYEVQYDPERMYEYGVSLQTLLDRLAQSNSNAGGDYQKCGPTVRQVRGLGLIGHGLDPMEPTLGMSDPAAAAAWLREEDRRRCDEVRSVVLASNHNTAVCVGRVVEDAVDPSFGGEFVGVLVGHQTRQGKVSMSRTKTDARGNRVWVDEEEKVQGIILLRKGDESLPALADVKNKVKELNETPGLLPPGMKIEPYYDRTDLVNVTTETVYENVLVGVGLVSAVLLMFLNNVRTALIVAINIPLALLFAFGVLYLRGKSANLLSIGAVDFGIIVDSSVIVVENVYRHLKQGHNASLPLAQRILRSCGEVEKSLLFSTVIMVCALLPLFTMVGPEGQIFGPMADTYAFALGGALLFALTVSPVLCLLFFWRFDPDKPLRAPCGWWLLLTWPLALWALVMGACRVLVDGVRLSAVWLLRACLRFRWVYLGFVAALVILTAGALPYLGREFMPELEEGNLYVRGTFPVNVSLEEAADKASVARAIFRQDKYPEVEAVVSMVGRPDDGTDPTGFYNVEFFVPLKPLDQWPVPQGHTRPRTKAELVAEVQKELDDTLIGVDWDISQTIRDNVMESLSGVKGENSIKIIGPDLDELERVAFEVKNALAIVPGVAEPGVFRIKGQTNLEFPVDRDKCKAWGVSVDGVQNVISTAVGGKSVTQVVEGEKKFDLTVRLPERLRATELDILQIPVEVNNVVPSGTAPSVPPTPLTGGSTGVAAAGTSAAMPAVSGGLFNAATNGPAVPRQPLWKLVSPLDKDGRPMRQLPTDEDGNPDLQRVLPLFVKSGASTIYREQGYRLIAVKFSVRGRDLAGAVADAQEKVAPLIPPGYRTQWSGEFEEMQTAERRLAVVVVIALVLIALLLYLAFHSVLDALVVLSNVGAVSLGGVWALLLTGTNFNISAAVGFISILGVAIMNGLLMVSSMNALRARGLPLREAVLEAMHRLTRPIVMTALAAIFGMLPAAFSTKIGSQSQQPLAIAVVGGMCMCLVMMHLVPVLYSFYGGRQPPAGAGELAH